MHARILLKVGNLERGLSKSRKKINLYFSFQPSSFNEQDYEKQKWPGTSNQSLLRLQKKFKKNPLLMMYYLTKFDGVIQSGFWVIPKNTFATCKPIHEIINSSTFICPFESGECGKEGKKNC